MNRSRFLLLLVGSLLLLAARSHAQAVMRKGDVFDMRLAGMPKEFADEFALQFTVSDDGTVDLPYIGSVMAAGISSTQFSHAVEAKLKSEKIFTNPTVTLALQPQSRFVTVGGGVRAPQAVTWSNDLTLSSAVMRAQGASDFGNLGKIKITRDGKTTVYNLKRFSSKGDQSQNPKLLPGDEVEVAE